MEEMRLFFSLFLPKGPPIFISSAARFWVSPLSSQGQAASTVPPSLVASKCLED